MKSIIDTWCDSHKCRHIKHNYSYQYELDCPCIDVIFPSALIRYFCAQKTLYEKCNTGVNHSLCEVKDRDVWKAYTVEDGEKFVVQTCTVKIVAPTIYFIVSEWQRWFSTTDSDTRQLWILRFELTSFQTTAFYSLLLFLPVYLLSSCRRERKRGTFVLK